MSASPASKRPSRRAGPAWTKLSERDLLPAIGGLPEYLNAERFRNDYESPDSPQFKAMSRDIENRLSSLPLYRP